MAFACYLTVSVIVPIITNEPLPLAFLADLIGGAFVLTLASFVISLAGLDTAGDRRAFRALLRQLATHANNLNPVPSPCDVVPQP